MLRQMKGNYQPHINDYSNLCLPNRVSELLNMYENEEAQFIRLCILSKIKHIIFCHVLIPRQTSSQLSENQQNCFEEGLGKDQLQIFYDDPKNPNTLFSALFLRFLKRGYRNRSIPKNELALFYHVVSLAIKYFYSEDHFKFLFNEITELIQNHKERIQTALDFFIEVIATIEYNYEESLQEENLSSGTRLNHCKFERLFTTSHLNSMLMIANFFMEKAVLKDNEAIEDGLLFDNFKMKASEEHIYSILQLLHKVLCFDFIGEKYSDNQENGELTAIIIPTKYTKYTNLSEFEKWLKNSDWIRIYQFIFYNCEMASIKLVIIEILGDMARIHMKYFKNKNCYKVHIENIIYALAEILEHINVAHAKDQIFHLSIAIGRNLLKLTSPAIVPMFFEISCNLCANLLENIKNFLVDEIIGEEIFNVNIIYYFLKFIQNLYLRCKFQKSSGPFELIERVTRQICRNYENFLRQLLKRLFKNGILQKNGEIYQFRQDYLHLKESFESYNIQDLMVYLAPFKFMKPRYTSINSVQQLFVLTCAKFNRSIYILETFSRNTREREFALQMIEKSILQVIEWFTYTSYFKNVTQKPKQEAKLSSRFASKFQDNFELSMEPISEEYEQEIENESQYCQILRVICFFMLQCLNNIPTATYQDLNESNQIFKLINLCLLLCFRSDLQEKENEAHLNVTVRKVIEQKVEICLQILEKVYAKQSDYSNCFLGNENDMTVSTDRSKGQQQIEFSQQECKDMKILLETLSQVRFPFSKNNEIINQLFKNIEVLVVSNMSNASRTRCEA